MINSSTSLRACYAPKISSPLNPAANDQAKTTRRRRRAGRRTNTLCARLLRAKAQHAWRNQVLSAQIAQYELAASQQEPKSPVRPPLDNHSLYVPVLTAWLGTEAHLKRDTQRPEHTPRHDAKRPHPRQLQFEDTADAAGDGIRGRDADGDDAEVHPTSGADNGMTASKTENT